MIEYLEFEDVLVIAEAVLDIKAEVLAGGDRIHLLESAMHAPAAGFGVRQRLIPIRAKSSTSPKVARMAPR